MSVRPARGRGAAERPSTPSQPAPGAARRPRGSLATMVVDDLSSQIRDGLLHAGDKLPTEAALMQAYDVSRTVVREALSKLQAASVVETRHGIGTFVLAPRGGSVFRLDPSELAASVDVLAVLELRISLESEAAALAAQRCSEGQLHELRAALDGFARNVVLGEDTVVHDFRFHQLIAQATGNAYFVDIMDHLGTTLIPRTRVGTARSRTPGDTYLQRVNREHEAIYRAIARGDGDAARAAMRAHLSNSRERLRRAQQAAAAATTTRPGAPQS